MDVLTAIHERNSVLSYKDQPVEEEKLRIILDAGRFSPSVRNRQAFRFVVVRRPDTRLRLMSALNGVGCVAEAPVVVVTCATGPSQPRLNGVHAGVVDATNALAYMILQAHELGLGACWLVAERENEVREILGIPGTVRVAGIATIGYPAQAPERVRRKPLGELVSYERYA